MGLMAVAQSFGLLLIGMEWMGNPEWQSWIKLTQDQIQTAVFLQIVAGGHLLLFVMRSRGSTFSPPWPAKQLVLAIVGTQIFAVLMCGFGWFVTALPWTIILLVWIYMLVWMAVLDGVKLVLYSRLHEGADRPAWYTRFLKWRHPTQAVDQPGNVAQ
jgi:H+-transporting ATPase